MRKGSLTSSGPYLDAWQLDSQRSSIDDSGLGAEVVSDGTIVGDHGVDIGLWHVRAVT